MKMYPTLTTDEYGRVFEITDDGVRMIGLGNLQIYNID